MTLSLALTLLASACGDGTAPAPLLHGYDLVRVDDRPIPATLYRVDMPPTIPGGAAPICETRMLSGRLELGRGGRYTVTSSSLLVCDDGRPDVETRSTSGGTYSRSADTLTLTGDP